MQDLIRSRNHPLVKRLRAAKAGRGDDALVLIEGFRLVEEALASGLGIVEAAITPRGEQDARTRALSEHLAAADIVVRRVSDDVMDAIAETETSPGLLALARRPVFDEEQIFRGTPLIVVGAGIQNPGNVGALLRTAEAAGATGAYVSADSADTMSWKALRGAMGSAFRLPHVTGLAGDEILARLARRGVRTVATVAGADDRHDAVDFTGPTALLFGNEGSGLPAEIAARADLRVSIFMAAPVESLNVGVAAGILLFEAARQRRR